MKLIILQLVPVICLLICKIIMFHKVYEKENAAA